MLPNSVPKWSKPQLRNQRTRPRTWAVFPRKSDLAIFRVGDFHWMWFWCDFCWYPCCSSDFNWCDLIRCPTSNDSACLFFMILSWIWQQVQCMLLLQREWHICSNLQQRSLFVELSYYVLQIFQGEEILQFLQSGTEYSHLVFQYVTMVSYITPISIFKKTRLFHLESSGMSCFNQDL